MSNNMKIAVIYFEGKEITTVVFDRIISDTVSNAFILNNKEVAYFSKDYGYVIKSHCQL